MPSKRSKKNIIQGQRKTKRTGMQNQSVGYSQKVNPGIYNAPDIPKELSVSLYFRQQFSVETGQTFRTSYGVLEYLKNVPQYGPELYQLYKYSRVTMVKYDFEVVNFGGRPIEVLAAVLPYDEAQSATIAQIAEKPGTTRKTISAAGGMDRARISKKCVGQSWFGNPYYTKDYWISEDQANSGSPVDPFEPVVCFTGQPILNGSSISFVVVVKARYSIQFFDLKVSRQLGTTSPQSEEEEMVVVNHKEKPMKDDISVTSQSQKAIRPDRVPKK